jgi:hypothetical protein
VRLKDLNGNEWELRGAMNPSDGHISIRDRVSSAKGFFIGIEGVLLPKNDPHTTSLKFTPNFLL